MFVRKHGNIRTNSNVAHIQNDNHYNGSWNVVIDGMLFAIEKQTHTPNFCYYFSKLFDGNVFVLSFILWSNLALNEHRLRIQTHWNDVIIYRKSITFSNFKSVCNVMFSQKLYFNAISFSSHRRRKIFVHIYCMASNDFFCLCQLILVIVANGIVYGCYVTELIRTFICLNINVLSLLAIRWFSEEETKRRNSLNYWQKSMILCAVFAWFCF